MSKLWDISEGVESLPDAPESTLSQHYSHFTVSTNDIVYKIKNDCGFKKIWYLLSWKTPIAA